MKQVPPKTLGMLTLAPIDPVALQQFQHSFKERTLPKLREDERRRARNVAIARTKVAY